MILLKYFMYKYLKYSRKVLTYVYTYSIINIESEVNEMLQKIIKAFLNTRIADNLIDKYLEKQKPIDFAKRF